MANPESSVHAHDVTAIDASHESPETDGADKSLAMTAGLGATLRTYLRRWSRHAGIRGTFHSHPPDTERFPPEVEATLYQITRTALTAVAEAGARSVDVLLRSRGDDAVLVIEDDAGAVPLTEDTIGVARMHEYAAALGGAVELEPTPAGGTAIFARVPLVTSPYRDPALAHESQVGTPRDAPILCTVPAAEPTVATVARLRARLAELRTAVAARDEFVATVAHELRNPVAPLLFQIRLAIEKTEQMSGANQHVPPEWAQSQFRAIEQRLYRLLASLERLLDVSRLSTGRVDLQPEPLDFGHAVREIVSSFEAELVAAHCSLILEMRAAPRGAWDRMRLEQICRNLLTNAIRFGAGSPIEVTIDGDTEFAILQVRDHGVGIAPGQQSRMFERFERGAESRRGGFGIGLWVVKTVCAAMGGTVSVESTVGEGACFTVMLPRFATDSIGAAHPDGLPDALRPNPMKAPSTGNNRPE